MELMASESSALLLFVDAAGVDPDPFMTSTGGEGAALLDFGVALAGLFLALPEVLKGYLAVFPSV